MGHERLIFDTWGEFLDRVENGKQSYSDDHRRSRDKGESHWFGTESFKEAVSLAVSGWEDGAANSSRIAEPMFTHVSSMIEKQEIFYDVEGQGLDIGRFLDGEPEHWQRIETSEGEGQGHKIIRVGLNLCVSSGIEKRVIQQKGAAVHALVNLLEFAGHRCEVVAMAGVVAYGYGTRDTGVVLKRASENVDASRLAFGLAHPSMFRRLFFSLWETMERADKFGIPNSGYGNVSQCLEKFDIYVGGSEYGDSSFDNDASTEEWIIKQLKTCGVHLKKKEAAV